MTEELYSDTENKLSEGTGRIFEAMGSCPSYRVNDGSTSIEITTQKTPVAKMGEERWAGSSPSPPPGAIIMQTAVRTDSNLVVLSGSPGLVDAHLNKALDKAVALR